MHRGHTRHFIGSKWCLVCVADPAAGDRQIPTSDLEVLYSDTFPKDRTCRYLSSHLSELSEYKVCKPWTAASDPKSLLIGYLHF